MKIQLSNALLRLSRFLLALAASSLFGGSLLAQNPFPEVPTTIVAMGAGKAQFVDHDNDGDLDLFLSGVTGIPTIDSRIYVNNGGSFQSPIILPGLSQNASAWLDYDLDGDLDFVISGKNGSTPETKLYRNDGAGIFTLQTTPFPGVYNGAFAVGDFDNDGDPDIIVAGLDAAVQASLLGFTNNQGTFVPMTSTFAALDAAGVIAGDVDNDGDQDLLICGRDGTNTPRTYLYTNANGNFTQTTPSLPALRFAVGDFGDYDGDGDLDLCISGNEPTIAQFAAIYTNQGGGTFVQNSSPIDSVVGGSIKWADIDNDGDLDLLTSGTDPNGYTTSLYLNTSGVFVNTNAPFVDVAGGAAIFGDYDGDGKLDIFVIGGDIGGNPNSKLYHNEYTLAPVNANPQAPATMTFSAPANGDIRFTWTNGSDLITPAAGLSYELFLSTAPGLHDISSPASNPATGFHKVATFGGLQGNSWTWHGATCGNTYYARVQAIDGAYAGSTLSAEFSFKYPFDTQVTSLDPTLTVVDAANTDSIRWFDCVANAILPNTGASFIADHNGSYAAIMYRFGCVDTTDCKPIFLAAVEAPAMMSASVFPNPAHDRITARLAANAAIESVSVYDMQGRALIVPTLSIVHNEATLDLSALPAGLYVLRTTLSGHDGFATAKFKKD